MKNTSLIFIIIYLFTSCRSDRTSKLFNEALKNDTLKNYTRSIELYNQILEINPSDYASLINRGKARINNNDLEGLTDIEKAAKDFPNGDTYYNLAGTYLYLNKKTNLILGYLKKAESFKPNNPQIYFARANYYYSIDRNNDSIVKYANNFIQLNPKSSVGYLLLSEVYFNQVNYDLFINICDSIIKYDPGLPFPYNNRGLAKFKKGKIEDALIDINKSLSMDPKNSYAYKNRAIVELYQNDLTRACSDLNKARELGYRDMYGNEVDSLMLINCNKK